MNEIVKTWAEPFYYHELEPCRWYRVGLEDGTVKTACIMYPRQFKGDSGKYIPGEWYIWKNEDEMEKLKEKVVSFYTVDVGSIYAIDYEPFW